jgi:ribosomal protein S18 acetylase RimI-like enzyme
MEIRIRRARRTDHAALAALCGWPTVDDSPARSLRLFRKVVSDLACDLYVAEEGERPIGLVAVSYVRVLALGGQRATLEELVVHPERRLGGVGRRLVEFVVRRALRRGACAFEARPADEAAERFLDRLGFRPCGRRYARPIGEEPLA